MTSGTAVYDTDEQVLQIAFSAKEGTKDIGFSAWWRGTQTGTRQWVNEESNDTASCGFVDGINVFGCTSGTMSITKFGSAGSDVEGTFSGTFTLFVSNEKVTVTNGRFKVKRIY